MLLTPLERTRHPATETHLLHAVLAALEKLSLTGGTLPAKGPPLHFPAECLDGFMGLNLLNCSRRALRIDDT